MDKQERYLCHAGETFDLAAIRIFGDEKFAPELLAANPELCHKLVFDGGEKLYVPDFEPETDEEGEPATPPPWKQ